MQWPSASLEAVPNCPVCGSASRIELHRDLADDTFFTAPGTWCLQQCGSCGSGYLDPRPTRESIPDAYASYYTHSEHAGSQGSRLKHLCKRLLRQLSDAYVRSLTAPAERSNLVQRLGAAVVKSVPPCREVIDARYRHLRRPTPGSSRLLDIGCGGGDFLRRATILGWDAEGVDFDPKAVATAREAGLNVRVGSIDSYANERDLFDVITCNHVIEHVYEPKQLIEAMHRLIKPKGLLWIETPNIGSHGHQLFGKAWRGLEAPRHVTILNHRALRSLLQDAGFTIVNQTPWNFQHVRMMFAASEAIARHEDPHKTRTSPIPNWRLVKGLLVELLHIERREFSCFRAVKESR
jgi:2-polyprenyl-3-methyl-5-hydroxy-6-metoxy-1,4-benzoquinol methylase